MRFSRAFLHLAASVVAVLCIAAELAHASGGMSRRAGRLGFHGAIAYHAPTNAVGYAYDFRSARQAEVSALAQCGHPDCEVRIHVRNACGVLMGEPGRTFTARGATHEEAALHARRMCRTKPCGELAWVCTK